MTNKNKYLIKTVGLLIGDNENAEKLYKSFNAKLVHEAIVTLLSQNFREIHCNMLAVLCTENLFINYLQNINKFNDNMDIVVNVDDELSTDVYSIEIIIDENVLSDEEMQGFYEYTANNGAEIEFLINTDI